MSNPEQRLDYASIKLEPYGIYNIDRNYQYLNKIKWFLDGVEFDNINGEFFLKIFDIKVVFKSDYSFESKAYSFLGRNILLKLIDLNTSIEKNLIYLNIQDDKLSVIYNTLSIDNDNTILIGYISKGVIVKV